MSKVIALTMQCLVVITASDDAPDDWLTRVTRDDFPYWNLDGGRLTEHDGTFMLADNAMRNGVEDASHLDGWGDLERGMVTIEVKYVESFY